LRIAGASSEWKAFTMKAKQLLLVVILVGAIGAFIVNVGKDKNMI